MNALATVHRLAGDVLTGSAGVAGTSLQRVRALGLFAGKERENDARLLAGILPRAHREATVVGHVVRTAGEAQSRAAVVAAHDEVAVAPLAAQAHRAPQALELAIGAELRNPAGKPALLGLTASHEQFKQLEDVVWRRQTATPTLIQDDGIDRTVAAKFATLVDKV